MSERNIIQQTYDNWGRASGLEKKSGSWYNVNNEVVSVSNLQKSDTGPSYYFNQAFWIRQLGEERFPKFNKCHIRFRLGSLLGDRYTRLDRLLDLDFAITSSDRAHELTAMLNEQLLPVIHRGGSVAGLRALQNEGVFDSAGIQGPAQQLLARPT